MENKKNKCKGTISVWSRVTGFFSAKQLWNPGKQEEFKDRNTYNIKEETDGEGNDNGAERDRAKS